jgi:hypothetical protein
MKTNFVKKCQCCEIRYTNVNIPMINPLNKELLGNAVFEALIKNRFAGKFDLVGNHQVITAIYYQYEDVQESERYQELHALLTELAEDVYIDQQFSTPEDFLMFPGSIQHWSSL